MATSILVIIRLIVISTICLASAVPTNVSAQNTLRFDAPQLGSLSAKQIRDLSNWQRTFLRFYFGHRHSVTKTQMIAYQRTLKWFHPEDPAGVRRLSAESLLLASPLVAQVRIDRIVAKIPHGSEMSIVYDVQPLVIVRHLLGPSSQVKVGDHLLFADQALRIGAEYSDDQLVRLGTTPILFMSFADPTSALGRLGNVYVPTAPFVSKWSLDGNATLHVMSCSGSSVSDLVKGKSLGSLSQYVAAKYGISATQSEGGLLRAILRSHGISTSTAVATYASQLQTTAKARKLYGTLLWIDNGRPPVSSRSSVH